ncbi:DUF3592 domain-containing protein [Actinocorallia aurea]
MAFFVVFLGMSVFFTWGAVADLREVLALREDGVRTEAVALETRSETWTTPGSSHTDPLTGSVSYTPGSTHTVHYTKVGFTRNAEKVVEEITGEYRAGEKVDVVYDKDAPGKVRAASAVDDGGIAEGVFAILFSVAFLIFGIFFTVGWYRDPF